MLAGQQRVDLDAVEALGQRRDLLAALLLDRLAFARQFEERLDVGDGRNDLAVRLDQTDEPLALPQYRLAGGRVLPECGIRDLPLDLR